MYRKKYSLAIFLVGVFTFASISMAAESRSQDYSPNVHWVFCIDTSGSMKAKGSMDLLKVITEKITSDFTDVDKKIVKVGDRITVFSFDEEVRLEATSLYQTENDIIPIRDKLKQMNKRRGSLTFISEAVVKATDFTKKYNEFFHTNALYVFTDGKSEPYSPRWPKAKIEARKKRDAQNFEKISLQGQEQGMNVWVGVLKWEAFEDAKSLVSRMGESGHLVDLTDLNRLPVEKALHDFAQSVRTKVRLAGAKDIDFGTVPYKGDPLYQRRISVDIQTDSFGKSPNITGRIHFRPDNPSELSDGYPVKIKTTNDKLVLDFELARYSNLKPGTYKGKLKLAPSQLHFGALEIEPSELDIQFKKAGLISFYAWRTVVGCGLGLALLCYLAPRVRRKMPLKV
jgi:Mg-chelatase subunit ChlD